MKAKRSSSADISSANVQPEGQLERRLDMLESMASIFGVMHRGQDIYEHICHEVVDWLGVEMCAVLLYDPVRQGLAGHVSAIGVSDDDLQSYFIPLGPNSPVRQLWESGASYKSDNVLTDPIVHALGLDEFARKVGVRQTMLVGIKLEDDLIGAIQPSNKCDGSPFTDSDVRLLSIYASQVAVAIANQRLYQGTLAERDKLSRLHQVALAVQRAPSLIEKLRRIAEGIRETGWRRVVISLCDENLDMTEMISAGLSPDEEQSLRHSATLMEHWRRWLSGRLESARMGQSYFVPFQSQGEAERAGGGDDSWAEGDVLFIPVRDQMGRVACIINLDAPLDGCRPTLESLRMVELFAQEAAANIETAQLYQALQDQIIVLGDRAQRLALLNRISGMVGATLDLRAMLSNVSEQVTEAFAIDHCTVVLYDHDNRVGSCVAEYPERGMAGFSMSLADSLVIQDLYASAAPVLVNLLTSGAVLGAEMQRWLGRWGVESVLLVPLMSPGRLAGWFGLNFINRQRMFSADQVELCQTIANQTAAAVENARLFERVQSALHELEATNRTQAQLLATVQELSTPVVPVLDDILILPLIGFIDSDRAQRVMEGLLAGLEQTRAQVVLLDVTGVPVVDSGVADHLMRAARAAQLLGAHLVLVGIRPEVAQTIVGLGVHMSDIATRSDLRSGLEYALAITRRKIVPVG